MKKKERRREEGKEKRKDEINIYQNIISGVLLRSVSREEGMTGLNAECLEGR